MMILILVNVFLWGAFFQLAFFRRRGFAYETVREAAPTLAAPAPLLSITILFTFLLIAVTLLIYLPMVHKVSRKKE